MDSRCRVISNSRHQRLGLVARLSRVVGHKQGDEALMLKRMVRQVLRRLGVRLVRVEREELLSDINPSLSAGSPFEFASVPDLSRLERIGGAVPGMIQRRSGAMLFTLCYFQQERGDVAEIGSWQGRSSTFLGNAVRLSGNGKFFAIDHFRGNVGKEAYYVIGANDLSDLEAGFCSNIERVGLQDHVNLLSMPNDQAAERIPDNSLRFLFIDGDHTKVGVEKDLRLFLPKLIEGAIVAFDDCSAGFPGVVEAISDLLESGVHMQAMTYPNTFVMRYSQHRRKLVSQ